MYATGPIKTSEGEIIGVLEMGGDFLLTELMNAETGLSRIELVDDEPRISPVPLEILQEWFTIRERSSHGSKI